MINYLRSTCRPFPTGITFTEIKRLVVARLLALTLILAQVMLLLKRNIKNLPKTIICNINIISLTLLTTYQQTNILPLTILSTEASRASTRVSALVVWASSVVETGPSTSREGATLIYILLAGGSHVSSSGTVTAVLVQFINALTIVLARIRGTLVYFVLALVAFVPRLAATFIILKK